MNLESLRALEVLGPVASFVHTYIQIKSFCSIMKIRFADDAFLCVQTIWKQHFCLASLHFSP